MTRTLWGCVLLAAVLLFSARGNVCGAAEASAGPRQHPYLFFTADELPALRAKLTKEPFKTRWQVLLKNANRFLVKKPPAKGRAMNSSRPSLGVAGITAFAYAITGDAKYADRAKREVFGLCESEKWNDVRHWNRGADLNTAEISVACALVYDWCYDTFTPEERRRLREQVLAKALTPYMVSTTGWAQKNGKWRYEWWVNNPVNNWCGVCHGGCGLAALAFYDELPEAKQAVERAWPKLQKYLKGVTLADGAGHEGVMYNNYGVKFGNYFYAAASRFFGDDHGYYAELTDELAGYWYVYMQGPDMKFANFNDMDERVGANLYGSHPRYIEGGPNSTLCAQFESKVPGGDELLLWAADNGGATFYWKGASPFWFLWRREAPPAEPKPKLQDAVLFRGAGHAIFRSPKLWLVYNGGWISNSSHNNFDLGTFVLVADGERLVNDPGYGIKATKDHTTVVVNGKGQPPGSQATYRRFGVGEGFQYLASDLSQCYGEQLVRFVRHLIVVDGAYVVLLDDLEAGQSAEFEWRLQSRAETSAVRGERAAIARGKKMSLHVRSAAPGDAVVTVANDVLKGDRGKSVSDIYSTGIKPSEKRRQVTFVTVLYPTPVDGPAPNVEFSPGGKLTVIGEDRSDTIVFEKAPGGWQLRSVNGEDALQISTGEERTLVPFRRTGDD